MNIDIKIALLNNFVFFIYSYILSEEQLVLEQLVFNSPILLLNLHYFKLYTVHIVKKKILQAPILSFPPLHYLQSKCYNKHNCHISYRVK